MINPPIPQGINCTDPDEWYCFVNSVGEEYTTAFIKKYLITKEQRQSLFDWNLSIEDCLNGSHDDSAYSAFIKNMYDAWNFKLGEKRFGL